MVKHLASMTGDVATVPAEPDKVLAYVERLVERNLIDDPARRRSLALVFDYAQYLAPEGDLNALVRAQAANLVRLLQWAQNPYIKRVNTALCLVAEKLSEVNARLVQNPHVASIEVPLPSRGERLDFCRWSGRGADFKQVSALEPEQVADLANGLSLASMNVMLSRARQSAEPLDAPGFRDAKKTLIERQCQGLLEFVPPKYTLDLVAGFESAKQRLRDDAALLTAGRFESAPMGYLVCGPVGTGKTFLAECYAGSVGIPCVKLRNFRSKYVGETEGNLEQMLTVLRSLGPVVVIIDEADASLGSRRAEGDSGTSARVFSMIASQMGDTTYRGRIVWMLLTSRPDLLPIDIKRQGRAEVHIPLFYPADAGEMREMFAAMAKKNKVRLAPDALAAPPLDKPLSGADIESLLLSAVRSASTARREELAAADIAAAAAEFIPSAQGLEKELQEVAAVLECTQMSFLPPRWRDQLRQPDGRAKLQERFVALRQLVES
jgi:SpoVK/Ycf46/Vps4 family AAA+-type ATPase